MFQQTDLAGNFTLPGTSMTLNRMGYGAMQLAGPQVWGPPRDVDAAIAVLREAVDAGVNHIDTSDFYGPHVTNQLIRQALHPYLEGLVIVTKLGARRGADKSWLHALSRQELIDGVHDNLRNLGRDTLDVVNLRVGGVMGPSDGSIEEPLTVLAELKRQGLIRHIGLSNVTPTQFAQGRTIAEIVCVQNVYNVAHRNDDGFVDDLAARGVAYVPFFPLGGFTPLQSSILDDSDDEQRCQENCAAQRSEPGYRVRDHFNSRRAPRFFDVGSSWAAVDVDAPPYLLDNRADNSYRTSIGDAIARRRTGSSRRTKIV